jgi:hypothetical protein
MARQKGPLRFEGSVGELSFYRDKQHGYIVRRKGGPSRRQIKTRKSCARVRENNEEFGLASSAGALLRQAFAPLIQPCREYSMSRRLQAELLALVKADTTHGRGERKLLPENLPALKHFELSALCPSSRYFLLPVQRKGTGEDLLVQAPLLSLQGLVAGATHFEVCSVVVRIDFDKRKWSQQVQYSGKLKVGSEALPLCFNHDLPGEGILFYGAGILFYQEVNGAYKLLQEERIKCGFLGVVGDS